MKRTIRALAAAVLVSGTSAGAGLGQALPQGVTTRDVTFHSEFVALAATMYFPRGYSQSGSFPAVVLAPGWAMTADDIDRFGQRFAQRGLVAMVIDYRGWGDSGGFVTLAEKIYTDDRLRRHVVDDAQVRIRRGRIHPTQQMTDIKMAIAFLQGEPGVDRERIGLWGTGEAGGYVVSIAAIDPRVRAGVAHTPSIPGRGQPLTPPEISREHQQDWTQQARTGRGRTYEAHASGRAVTLDVETARAAVEFRPFHDLAEVPENFPLLFVVAGNEQRFDNREHAIAAAEALRGPTEIMTIANATFQDTFAGAAFDRAANAAADWLVRHLGAR
jgi:uncharacterized protein